MDGLQCFNDIGATKISNDMKPAELDTLIELYISKRGLEGHKSDTDIISQIVSGNFYFNISAHLPCLMLLTSLGLEKTQIDLSSIISSLGNFLTSETSQFRASGKAYTIYTFEGVSVF